jgi:hypothetical protein
MESINELLGRGFSLWRDNLNLCIPHLLGFFFSMMALFAGLMAVILSGMLPLEGLNETALYDVQNMQDMQKLSDQMEEYLAGMQSSDLMQIGLAILAIFVLVALVDAFFCRRSHRHGQAGPGEGKIGYECHVVCWKAAFSGHVFGRSAHDAHNPDGDGFAASATGG